MLICALPPTLFPLLLVSLGTNMGGVRRRAWYSTDEIDLAFGGDRLYWPYRETWEEEFFKKKDGYRSRSGVATGEGKHIAC
jgi:hypothetical protein